ncbi:hypothetical protein ES703_91869 [subsurface metagenome]
MLPGQSKFERIVCAASVIPVTLEPTSTAASLIKYSMSSGISSALSRRAGREMFTPLILKYKSCLNFFSSISLVRIWLVALMMRTSTTVCLFEPTGITMPSSMTRSSLAWELIDISPISSKNNVPLSVSSNSPFLSLAAPVKAPLVWPNSSLSNKVSVRPAQFTGLKDLSQRSEL